MVFKRRDRRPIWRIALEFLWPRGGWGRAARYVRHRVRRLPDTPEKIARGIWAGVFTTFTPFYGLHFIVSAALAKAMRGNIVAALLATFFGNPLTYVPIGIISLRVGHWILGSQPPWGMEHSLLRMFSGAGNDLWRNFMTLFNGSTPDWYRLSIFYHEVFLPYLVGGILPGIIVASVGYYLTLPVIRAYQNRRRKMLRAKLDKLKTTGG
ncbi:DUF2062 domain-containing protein [Pelagovum pacificum]|uniref:DUF2062 domain-containing protein n=1 Tax=Pelagovum pacificum TaxID=2588711 RepID=A0A5C5GHK8_9RHOB|nr:DUF2062 domain-containing protein [Pelagovum pacificum]QQA43265.1 DUF2062 domain-containing protein [Pelagovum pacificum]TNY33597.1 DUF2062 domain-containing protein [Pelagovum pacificum]